MKQLYGKYKTHYTQNFHLAYPVVISQLGHTLVGLSDSIIIGHTGKVPLAAVSLGVIFLSVVGFLLPTATLWRVNSFYAMGLAIAALFLIRLALTQSAGADAFKRRILVLGAAGPSC